MWSKPTATPSGFEKAPLPLLQPARQLVWSLAASATAMVPVAEENEHRRVWFWQLASLPSRNVPAASGGHAKMPPAAETLARVAASVTPTHPLTATAPVPAEKKSRVPAVSQPTGAETTGVALEIPVTFTATVVKATLRRRSLPANSSTTNSVPAGNTPAAPATASAAG